MPLHSPNNFKVQVLHYAARHPFAAFLDSSDTEIDRYGRFEWLAAWAGADAPTFSTWDDLYNGGAAPDNWSFGAFSYELKDRFEPKLHSGHNLPYDFPELYFFEPEVVLAKERGKEGLTCLRGNLDELLPEIRNIKVVAPQIRKLTPFESNFTQEEYLAAIEALRQHIKEGDSYEINLSQLFRADLELNSAAGLFQEMLEISPKPFGAYMRWHDLHLLCASPERFLQVKGDRILTQPIKGTAPRFADTAQDQASARALRESEKERAENVMIVDLSRNDLYRSSEVNSVEVPHLFEVQSFPQVHHLVSTIQGRRRGDLSPLEVFRNTFPPGSMTGAPKVRSCELIEQYEKARRGIYSGAAGYFEPGGDFDLNVVIRSLIWDASAQTVSYHVGGAITYDSAPQAEYDETLLKAKGIGELFQSLRLTGKKYPG